MIKPADVTSDTTCYIDLKIPSFVIDILVFESTYHIKNPPHVVETVFK